jgi:hypothetical protein
MVERKRKRREPESAGDLDSKLCEKCRTIFATVESLRKVICDEGFKHYNNIELLEQAGSGCTLCSLLFDKLGPITLDTPRYIQLSALSKNGTAIRSTTETRYPHASLDMRFLKATWINTKYISRGYERSHRFDIIALNGSPY